MISFIKNFSIFYILYYSTFDPQKNINNKKKNNILQVKIITINLDY